MSAANAKPSPEIKGWHVLAAMLAGFGVVIAVNVAFAVIAVSTFPGEDVRRSYLQGLQYNETLAARREQAALGWAASAAFVTAEGDSVVAVALSDREGRPLVGASLRGDLQWPTNAGRDRALTFEAMGDGRYIARTSDLQPGRWRLRGRAERDEGALDFEAELIWPTRR